MFDNQQFIHHIQYRVFISIYDGGVLVSHR